MCSENRLHSEQFKTFIGQAFFIGREFHLCLDVQLIIPMDWTWTGTDSPVDWKNQMTTLVPTSSNCMMFINM